MMRRQGKICLDAAHSRYYTASSAGVFCPLWESPTGGIVKIVCVGGGPAGLYFSILMKLWNPANRVIVFERDKEGVTHGWGVIMERRFLGALAEFDAES